MTGANNRLFGATGRSSPVGCGTRGTAETGRVGVVKLIRGPLPATGGATALFIDWIGPGGGVGFGFHGVGVGVRGPGVY